MGGGGGADADGHRTSDQARSSDERDEDEDERMLDVVGDRASPPAPLPALPSVPAALTTMASSLPTAAAANSPSPRPESPTVKPGGCRRAAARSGGKDCWKLSGDCCCRYPAAQFRQRFRFQIVRNIDHSA